MKLICFTYAGGSASFYDRLKEKLVPEIELIAPEYSGHGSRHRSPFYSDFAELAADMYSQIEEIPDAGPYALMGYSMGSISAVEVLKTIIEKKKPLPEYIFLAAHEPHNKSVFADYSSEDIDKFVKERTIRFGGVPERLLNNESFWRMYLPIYKADYLMIAKYKFENLDLRSKIPAAVFYSGTDTAFADMEKWGNYFENTDFLEYKGNHFFINDHLDEIAQEIKKRLVYEK